MKVSKKVAGVEYAIRDIVSAAREIEQQGRSVDYLNIGDPIQFGFQPPDNVRQALIDAVNKTYGMKIDTAELKKQEKQIGNDLKELSDQYSEHKKLDSNMYM